MTSDDFNHIGAKKLPGYMGIIVTKVDKTEIRGQITIQESHMAPNGYLHAGTVITLADTCAGYGCVANLPQEASGFTTVELKSNHVGTAREGIIECVATPVHKGRTTQVWDAIVTHKDTGKTIAMFRCTQMVLYK